MVLSISLSIQRNSLEHLLDNSENQTVARSASNREVDPVQSGFAKVAPLIF
jgi:hypothetical protein